MKAFRLVSKTAAIVLLVLSNQAQARKSLVPSYQEMLAKSDLVVIANPTRKTVDTQEKAVLPSILRVEKSGKQSRIDSIGVETLFAVSAVLKGDATVKEFTLHHYREAKLTNEADGPYLVHFDPSDASKRSCYLMFLVREPDGRYAPIGGQTDPGMKAISPIPFELH